MLEENYKKVENSLDFLLLMCLEYKLSKKDKTYIRVRLKEIIPDPQNPQKMKEIKTHPDIDLLYIDSKRQNPFDSSRKGFIEAFEIKTLGENSFREFYAGLGQAMMYYRFGIDKVTLIVGYFGNNENRIEEIYFKLRKDCSYLQKHFWQNKFLYVNFFIKSKGEFRQIFPLLKQPPEFPKLDEEALKFREQILNMKIIKSKEWIKNYYKKRAKKLGIEKYKSYILED